MIFGEEAARGSNWEARYFLSVAARGSNWEGRYFLSVAARGSNWRAYGLRLETPTDFFP